MSSQTHGSGVALVTGSSRGIGAQVAIRLAESGFDVVVHCHRRSRDAQTVAENVQNLGRRARVVQTDLGKPSGARELYETTDEAMGRLDVVVNNAGLLVRGSARELDRTIWHRTFAINLEGLYRSCVEAEKRMRRNVASEHGIQGRIVNMGSMGGMQATPQSPHYGASKAAVHHLTKSLAELFAPHVLVNAVAPGFVDTEMIAGLQRVRGETSAQTPLGRWAEPSEVVEVVTYLATSPTFVTGQILPIDGGLGNVYVNLR